MKIGRNDPCPCGSGKKYKNCCLRKETMSIPDRIREAVRERGYKEDIGDMLSSMYGKLRVYVLHISQARHARRKLQRF